MTYLIVRIMTTTCDTTSALRIRHNPPLAWCVRAFCGWLSHTTIFSCANGLRSGDDIAEARQPQCDDLLSLSSEGCPAFRDMQNARVSAEIQTH